MPTFIYKWNKQRITLDGLPEGPMKESFRNLTGLITDQLRSTERQHHHLEPVVMLQARGENVTYAGCAACCPEFSANVKEIVELPEGVLHP